MPAPVAAALAAANSIGSTLATAARTPAHDRFKTLGQEFEAVFLANMMEEMFAGIEDDDPFGSGPGSQAWRSIRTEEFARAIAAAGGIGLAQHVQQQLIALQEKSS